MMESVDGQELLKHALGLSIVTFISLGAPSRYQEAEKQILELEMENPFVSEISMDYGPVVVKDGEASVTASVTRIVLTFSDDKEEEKNGSDRGKA